MDSVAASGVRHRGAWGRAVVAGRLGERYSVAASPGALKIIPIRSAAIELVLCLRQTCSGSASEVVSLAPWRAHAKCLASDPGESGVLIGA